MNALFQRSILLWHPGIKFVRIQHPKHGYYCCFSMQYCYSPTAQRRKIKHVFMMILRSRKMTEIFAVRQITRNRLSKLQAKSYHLWDVTWKNPPLNLVKCGDLPLGRNFYLKKHKQGLIVHLSPFWTWRTRFRRPATEFSA
jgi:hypothetical protein